MKLKKWLALGLTLAMAGSVLSLVACGDEEDKPGPTPTPPVDEIIDDSDQATEGLEYTEVYENGKFVGYSVGIGTAFEEEYIYVPAIWEGERVVSVGVEPSTYLKLMQEADFDNLEAEDKIAFMQKYAITYSNTLTSIHLPDSLKYFGYAAFMVCPALQEIAIPKNVTEINDYTFYHDISLSKVTFATDAKLDYIGAWAFYNCISLSKIYLPDSLNDIDMYAFAMSGDYNVYELYGLSDIDLGTGVSSIGEGAFYRCGLTSVSIPDSVADIGEKTFSECAFLKSANIGSGVRVIPNEMFYGCGQLTTVRMTGARKIEEKVFVGCEALTAVNFGEHLESVGFSAFFGCSSLAKVVLPDSIQTIANAAFQACRALEEVTLGANIWDIGQYAFDKGNGVLPGKIYYNGTEAEYAHVGGAGKPMAPLVTFLK